jgi:hypothetical protein
VQSSRCSVAVDGDFAPRQAHDPVAGELQIGVGGGVALAVAAGSVEREAIELDDEPVSGPDGVHLGCVSVALNQRVEERVG